MTQNKENSEKIYSYILIHDIEQIKRYNTLHIQRLDETHQVQAKYIVIHILTKFEIMLIKNYSCFECVAYGIVSKKKYMPLLQ